MQAFMHNAAYITDRFPLPIQQRDIWRADRHRRRSDRPAHWRITLSSPTWFSTALSRSPTNHLHEVGLGADNELARLVLMHRAQEISAKADFDAGLPQQLERT